MNFCLTNISQSPLWSNNRNYRVGFKNCFCRIFCPDGIDCWLINFFWTQKYALMSYYKVGLFILFWRVQMRHFLVSLCLQEFFGWFSVFFENQKKLEILSLCLSPLLQNIISFNVFRTFPVLVLISKSRFRPILSKV